MKVDDGCRTSPIPTIVDKVTVLSDTCGRIGPTLRHQKLHLQVAQALSFEAFLRITHLSQCLLATRRTSALYHTRLCTLGTHLHHRHRHCQQLLLAKHGRAIPTLSNRQSISSVPNRPTVLTPPLRLVQNRQNAKHHPPRCATSFPAARPISARSEQATFYLLGVKYVFPPIGLSSYGDARDTGLSNTPSGTRQRHSLRSTVPCASTDSLPWWHLVNN